jgi:adenylate cyclase
VQLYPDKHEENSALISHHFELAGDMREAARWSATAANWVGRSNHAEAVRHWQKVRSLVATLPEDDESELLGLLSCIQALAHGWRLGLPKEETDELASQGRRLAEQRKDLVSLAMVTALDAGLTGLHGAPSEGYERAVEADAIAEKIGPTLRLIVGPPLVYMGLLSGRLQEAIDITERLLATPPDDPMTGADLLYFSPYIWMVVQNGFLLGYSGRLREGVAHFERALELARQNNDLENAGWTHGAHVQAAWLTGDLSLIGTHPEQAVEIAERIGSSFSQVIAYANIAMAHLLREDFAASIEAAERSIFLAQERNIGLEWIPLALEFQAQAYLGASDPRARATAERAVSIARGVKLPIIEAQALRVLGRVLIRTGAIVEARDALARSLALIGETGARSLEPFVHEELAELARRTGDQATHDREIRTAHRRYEEMGATGHLARLDPLVSSLS